MKHNAKKDAGALIVGNGHLMWKLAGKAEEAYSEIDRLTKRAMRLLVRAKAIRDRAKADGEGYLAWKEGKAGEDELKWASLVFGDLG